MNAYTFVAKKNNNESPQQEMRAGMGILQRLQQLKQSMRPAQTYQQQYQSTSTNKNLPHLSLSGVQNQRLNKYLPHETQPKSNPTHEQGLQQFESYRRSLQKKLGYLFEKQKQIMKTQSTYHPQQRYHNDPQLYAHQQTIGKGEIPHLLERKYREFEAQEVQPGNKQDVRTLIGRQTKSFSNINNHQFEQQRQHKAFSTIQTNNLMANLNVRQRKDEEIEQMQRKIKILEMKYLGGGSIDPAQNKRCQFQKSKQSTLISIQQNSEPNRNQRDYRSKSTKSKSKKQQISPSNVKIRTKNTQKQTIQNSYPSQKKQGKPQTINSKSQKQKQKIKEYLVQEVENNSKSENEQWRAQQQMLHRQFNSLKQQFQALLEINKCVMEKVELSSQERAKKKESKQRAKAMLKEILSRLDEIRMQIKGRSKCQVEYQQRINETSIKKQSKEQGRSNIRKKLGVFQKSIDWNCQKETPKDFQQQKTQFSKEKNPSPKRSPSKSPNQYDEYFEDVEKLKQLLELQIQHRSIVEKKLQIISGQKGSTQ